MNPKKRFLLFVLCLATLNSLAQIDWNNYSTSYQKNEHVDTDSMPMIITAIPYNGVYSNFDDIDGINTLKEVHTLNSRAFFVYDSSAVHFFAAGIFRKNAHQYEFCVLLNGKTFLMPWSDIDDFTNSSLEDFKSGFAHFGGFKTTWGNYLSVELRKKRSEQILSSSIVYWKLKKPELTNVYTINELQEVLRRINSPFNIQLDSSEKQKWQNTYYANDIDRNTRLPKKFIFPATDNALFFFMKSIIHKKEAMEYSLLKNGETIIDWKPNDFENNFIWLKDLLHGDYILRIRFRRQRQSVAEYSFEIKPLWQQSISFKIILWILIVAFLGFVIAIYRLWKQRKLSAYFRKEKTSLELKSMRAQLNPHFIFNSLSSIQGLINKNEIDNANKYLSDFSSLMRTTLTANDKDNNHLDEEIKSLNDYLQLEQLRFHFKYQININNSINSSTIEIPSLLLQPLVENAVKHGVSYLQEKGKVDIDINQKNNDLLVDIIDNGKGFDSNEKNSGYGLKLTKERIALINGMSKTQSIEMTIQSDKGTAVHLIFKNWMG